jgi:hypothetical protein
MAKTKAERKARERELAAERAARADEFNVPIPSHMRERLGLRSKINEALSVTGTIYNWGGVCLPKNNSGPVEPEPYLTPMDSELGANVTRKENALLVAQELRRKYIKLWNIRGGAKRIASEEGIGLSTVYAHMARLRDPSF